MDKLMRTALLFDFYGPLLTAKQRSFYEMYYLYDLSLSEIAEVHSVTPQAVSDLLKRTVGRLEDYESKLGMLGQYTEQSRLLNEAVACIDAVLKNEDGCHEMCEKLLDAKKKILITLAL